MGVGSLQPASLTAMATRTECSDAMISEANVRHEKRSAMPESHVSFGRSAASKRGCASAFFLSRIWRNGSEKQKFLEGKIKARSRKLSQVVVCTSFFREIGFGIGRNCETLGAEATLFWGFGLPLASYGLQMALLP
jgi:hypothetical protein